MHDIAMRKGDFTLFALFRRASSPWGQWDLVASARWLGDGRFQFLSELVDLIAELIGRKALSELARVVIIPTNDPTVKLILDNFPVDDGERRIGSNDLFGLQMDDAIILHAKRPSSKRPARKTLEAAGAGPSRRRG